MKVVILQDDFPPESFGGAGISTYELAKGVQEAGHEVYVITAGRANEESEYNGLKVFKVDSKYHERWRAYLSLYNPRAVRRVEEILKEIKPDIVHANNIHFFLSYHSLRIAKKYARVVVTLRDAMSFSFGKLATEKYQKNFDARLTWLDQLKQANKRWNPLRNFIIRRYLKSADKIFAVSEALRLALEQNGIKGIEVMHTGLDTREYQWTPTGTGKVLFFAGRLSDAKGAKVVRNLMQKLPEAKLVTAGATGHWLNREEMKKAYAASSVVLVPSICFDALPRTVLEAMALGKPVVATCYGGAKEAVIDGVTGFVVNPFDTGRMAEKVLEILKDPERFGQAARARIEAEFNLNDKIAELVKIYERLC
ncbi:MAG: hypothetical protein A2758_01580 [Candidatus Zambryskibacteria bacterium RIFCSPHIGHO2_01_FULL_49_18]|uniref:Glycosyltransferase subfamily 4-like N-terminal domain-containing protein n=2 Tax=Candidatus Zambryskiibacteriota TaxID=1817925 RepID=A0A1G2T1J4_9BACT|nr:MAG: hypothetical protein A2758_01580 [Candidatus Zambryskibacteria bacterium RIFCSPHIGHO2_01_FULL_49_18]OHB05188.1 MAG: hypothetical protein A3A26_02715 [Candidatus Zambryskibacteria bacterium RIFCSPLOWO2_01_FULL_47_14]